MTAIVFRSRIAGLMACAALGLIAAPALAQTATAPATETAPAPAPTPEAGTSAAPAAPTAEAEAAADGEIVEGAPLEVLPDIVLGREDAPLTVIEYASLTCPHCGTFAKENLPKLEAEYIDTGKVRFIQRPVYFDAVGLWAGILAQCDPAKYYPISETLLTTQDEWISQNGDEIAQNLRQIGLAAGMTSEQMDACWNDRAKIERMVATYQTNATADGLEGTPTFIIGGEKVPNQPWEDLKAKIDEKLAAAPAAATPATPADAATPSTPATPADAATPAAPAEPAATPTTPAAPATPATPATPAPAN